MMRTIFVIAGTILLSAADNAVADCLGGGTSRSVNSSENLTQIIEQSVAPCTLNVGPGIYNAAPTSETGDSIFRISAGITIRSTAGAAATTLRVTPGKSYAVLVQALNGRCPSGATLEGFTLEGGLWGVYASAVQTGYCASNIVSGITLRNLIVNTEYNNTSAAHGIDFAAVQNSVIDSCTINTSRVNGIYIHTEIYGGIEIASNNNIVMNNTVVNTLTQHAIAIQGSSNNVVVGNTVNGSAFDGILLNSPGGQDLSRPGSSGNRIERNTISGYRTDGITLTDASGFNFVGLNSIVSSSYHPQSKPTPDPTTGVGIWVNNASNGNYLFGNDLSGSPENGIDVLTSNSTYVHGNRVHANFHGGIWLANYLFAADSSAPIPTDTVIHGNYSYFNTSNAQVIIEGASNVDVAYNYLSGEESGTLAGLNTGGVIVSEGGAVTRGASADSRFVTAYENSIASVNNRAVVQATSRDALFFRNRFLNGSNNPNVSDGRQGLTYSMSPGDIEWDSSRFLGGNHWSEYNLASGNPDTDSAHWYREFVYDNVNGIDGNAPYADKFPYQSESLATAYAPNSVTVLEPFGEAAFASGTRKTIHWVARGCVLVDLYYGPGSGTTYIGRYPNVGHYIWTVPSAAFRTDYVVDVICLDSNGVNAGASGRSDDFTIASSDLVLMNPGRDFRAQNGGTLRVAWKKSSAVGGVNIFVRSGSGTETQVAANQTGTFADITLPSSVSNSSQVRIRIQDSASSTRQDSNDGDFMVRGTPTFMTALAGQSLQMGSIVNLEWAGASNSYTVDLELYENNQPARDIVLNLPDFGNYTWFVPEMWSSNSTVHATFKDEDGVVVGEIDSGTFSVFYSTNAGFLVDRFRLYSPVTLEHHFTTDAFEYSVLGGSSAWNAEGAASKMHNGPATVGGVVAVPYYRLYDHVARWHHWTTDRNEYFVLRQNPGRYYAEGVDGYIFQTQVAGTVPWYRLLYAGIAGLHHWTADQNERDVLVGGGGWIEEQREYVFPP